MRITTFCDNNWYDPGCNTNCVPQDSCDGHYTCNPIDGSKVCLPGYSGTYCEIADLTQVGCTIPQGNYLLLFFFLLIYLFKIDRIKYYFYYLYLNDLIINHIFKNK